MNEIFENYIKNNNPLFESQFIFDDNIKEIIIGIALKEFMKGINSNSSCSDEFIEEVNSLFRYIIENVFFGSMACLHFHNIIF